jgi:hypothetical protein
VDHHQIFPEDETTLVTCPYCLHYSMWIKTVIDDGEYRCVGEFRKCGMAHRQLDSEIMAELTSIAVFLPAG